MLTVSLTLNVIVLVPVVLGLLREARWVNHVYGAATPARGILTAVYTSILVMSAGLLALNLANVASALGPALGLLTAQVIYKLLSPGLVGDLRNPVVLSNLAIAAVHLVTLALLAPGLVLDRT